MPPLRIVRVHDLSVPGNLSRVSWKLSRTVLRGGTSRKVGPLLDLRHEAACVIVRRAPLDRTCHPIGSTLRGMAIR